MQFVLNMKKEGEFWPRRIIPLECWAAFLCACRVPAFMCRFYEWNNHELLGISFGAVNGSIWRVCKTLLLPYLLWGLIEILAVKRVAVPVHRRKKTAGLYLTGVLYLALRLCGMHVAVAAVLSLAAGFAVSAALYCSDINLRGFFAPSVALLFLFVALYLSGAHGGVGGVVSLMGGWVYRRHCTGGI